MLDRKRAASITPAGALGKIIDAMHARLQHAEGTVDRARLETSVVMAISMVAGWAIAGPVIERAAGRAKPCTREDLRRELALHAAARSRAPVVARVHASGRVVDEHRCDRTHGGGQGENRACE